MKDLNGKFLVRNLFENLKKNFGSRWCERGGLGICSEEDFKFLLKRERARADRGHSVFSLVVFVLTEEHKKASRRRLVAVLKERVRITDSIGWLKEASVGVLLSDTPCEGGKSFLKDVLVLIHDIQPAPECHVYTYPSAPVGNGCRPTADTPGSTGDAECSEAVFNEILAVQPSLGQQFFERTGAGVALLVLSPLLLLIAAAIRRASPGPALFSQWRVGHKGTAFRCYKFRTMHLNAATDVHEKYFKTLIATDVPMRKLDGKADSRIFRAGRLLRSSSLDELPQLFNVLKGEMSFVGPRPPIPGEYRDYLPWHRHRVDVLPGLTGLWQVSGKNKTTFTEMMRFDVRYARQKSLRQDLGIIFKTPRVIITQFMEDHRLVRLFPGLSFNERERALSRGKPEISKNKALSGEGK